MRKLIIGLFLVIGSITNVYAETISVGTYNTKLNRALLQFENKNYEKAFPSILNFAKNGEKIAQYLVAVSYLQGLGTEEDISKSYYWMSVAVEQKDRDWLATYENLKQALPATFVDGAQPEIDTYIKQYGAKAQELQCRYKKVTGSQRKVHKCTKMETRKGRYSYDPAES